MSQAPHRDPPPPHPTPDDPYDLQPVQPVKERNLTAEIVTISVIVAGLVLLGVGIMLWRLDSRPAAPPPAPTSTPTQTDAAPVAAQSAIAARPLVTPRPVRSPTRTAPASLSTAASATIIAAQTQQPAIALPLVAGSTSTPTSPPVTSDVHLPAVSADGPGERAESTVTAQPPTQTPTPSPDSQTISLPFVSREEVQPSPTATALPPTATPEPTATGETVTATSTPAIASSPTPTSYATVTPFLVNSLKAKVDRQSADFHIGPSAVYTLTDTLGANAEITLYGRNDTGEWLYACCVVVDKDEDTEGLAWVRQAFIRIEGNESDDDPEDFNANDAHWLRIVPTREDLRPLPVQTPPPEGDYPLFRYTPDNRGYMPNLPNLSTAVRPWTNEPEAGGALISPLIVADSLVVGASSDGHVYTWDRVNGSQRARKDLGQSVTVAPATDDGLIYIADEAGTLYALQDPIDDDPVWSRSLGGAPISGINVYSHTLFLNRSQRLMVIDGEESDILYELSLPVDPQYPAIGGQLLYVVADTVRAYDVLNMIEQQRADLIWEQSSFPAGAAPPVYSTPGVKSLAELYVAGGNNRVYSLDANTGEENWNQDNEEAMTSLAVNDTTLFVAGNGYIKARSREDGEQLWRTPVGGPVLGGPLVDRQYVIAFLQNGNIVFLNAETGQDAAPSYPTYPAASTSAGAVSFPYIYVPGQDGKLHAYRQTP